MEVPPVLVAPGDIIDVLTDIERMEIQLTPLLGIIAALLLNNGVYIEMIDLFRILPLLKINLLFYLLLRRISAVLQVVKDLSVFVHLIVLFASNGNHLGIFFQLGVFLKFLAPGDAVKPEVFIHLDFIFFLPEG